MKLLDLTLPTAAENLALDEALLDAAEAGEDGLPGEFSGEVLRLWESPRPLVVIGRSSRLAEEVNRPACEQLGVPVLRRASGGAAIVAGPGCLMYALVLRYAGREHLRLLDQLHQQVLGSLAAALAPLAPGVQHLGTCDLAIGDRKFSGNSVRCKRDHFLYHGTLLYDFDLGLIETLLRMPPRQPDYRAARPHERFVANLKVSAAELRAAMMAGFRAAEPLADWPHERTSRLVAERYSLAEWNRQR